MLQITNLYDLPFIGNKTSNLGISILLINKWPLVIKTFGICYHTEKQKYILLYIWRVLTIPQSFVHTSQALPRPSPYAGKMWRCSQNTLWRLRVYLPVYELGLQVPVVSPRKQMCNTRPALFWNFRKIPIDQVFKDNFGKIASYFCKHKDNFAYPNFINSRKFSKISRYYIGLLYFLKIGEKCET